MTSYGMSNALSGLHADQVLLDAISQDLANAQTPGYVKTTVQLSPTGTTGVGTGVAVVGIGQIMDPTLAAAVTATSGQASYAAASASALAAAQDAVPEPSSNGLSAQLTALWSDLDALGSAPSSATAASILVSQASTVAATITGIAQHLTSVTGGLAGSVSSTLGQDNQLLAQVATLNSQIVAAQSGGQGAGGLIAQRNQIVGQLASDLGVTAVAQPDGSQTLYLGGVTVVQGTVASTLSTVGSADDGTLQIAASTGGSTVVAAAVGNGGGGTVGGYLDAIDTAIPAFRQQLDGVAVSLVDATSSATTAAGAGASLYIGTSAATLAVNPAVTADPGLLGAAGGVPVDGSAYQALAEAATGAAATGTGTLTFGGGSLASPDGLWQQLVLGIGTATSNANSAAAATASAAGQATARWQGAEGVDQNTELTTMLQVQNAYQACAKALSTIDATIKSLLEAV